jgi:hypothetical protein
MERCSRFAGFAFVSFIDGIVNESSLKTSEAEKRAFSASLVAIFSYAAR